MVQAVIFDMDGVLTDSEPVICAAAIRGLREYGISPSPADFVPFVGMGEDRYIGGVAEQYGLRYRVEMKRRVYEIYLEILPELLRGFPGVHELIGSLRARRLALAVASSADRVTVEANLRGIEVSLSWFGAVVTGEDVVARKPAPDIFLAAARGLGIDPRDCCVVEDAVSGVAAAKAAGMRCVAVATSFPESALREAGADMTRPALAEVTLADLGIV